MECEGRQEWMEEPGGIESVIELSGAKSSCVAPREQTTMDCRFFARSLVVHCCIAVTANLCRRITWPHKVDEIKTHNKASVDESQDAVDKVELLLSLLLCCLSVEHKLNIAELICRKFCEYETCWDQSRTGGDPVHIWGYKLRERGEERPSSRIGWHGCRILIIVSIITNCCLQTKYIN